MTKCELLTRISEIQFVCVELNLYLTLTLMMRMR